MKVIYSILFALAPFMALAQTPARYQFLFDTKLSSPAAAEFMVTLHKGLYTLENGYLPVRLPDSSGRIAGVLYYLGKGALLDMSIDLYTMLIQHEIFGHGARYREYGFEDNVYHLSFPDAWAHRGKHPLERRLDPDEEITVSTAGMEADILMAYALRSKWLQRRSINYRESLLYCLAFHDISLYVLKSQQESAPTRNDINSYLRKYNNKHGFFLPENYKLSIDELRQRIIVNFLDPFTYFALYSYITAYLGDRHEYHEIPMVKVGKGNYLPSIRLGLSPFGSEITLDNYACYGPRVFNLFFRSGDNIYESSWGAGLQTLNVVSTEDFSLSTDINFWKQPPFFSEGVQKKPGFGGAAGAIITYDLTTREFPFRLGLSARLLYKTDGFMPGESLNGGFIFRAGLGIKEHLPQ